jgi:hypothetical protein
MRPKVIFPSSFPKFSFPITCFPPDRPVVYHSSAFEFTCGCHRFVYLQVACQGVSSNSSGWTQSRRRCLRVCVLRCTPRITPHMWMLYGGGLHRRVQQAFRSSIISSRLSSLICSIQNGSKCLILASRTHTLGSPFCKAILVSTMPWTTPRRGSQCSRNSNTLVPGK